LLYLICAILMPSDLGSYANYRAYFYSRWRWLFGLPLVFSIIDLIDSAPKGPAHLMALGWPHFAVVATRSALLIGAIKTCNAKYHAFVAIIGQLILPAFRTFHTMQ
jgi:hypothetical protein